jgi:hypothetical protein
MKLLVMFVAQVPVLASSRLIRCSRVTVTNFYDNCRGVYSDALHAAPIAFTRYEFEVDELVLSRVWDEQNGMFIRVWIGGILERGTGRLKLYRLADRTINAIIPPIMAALPAGAYIYSDELAAYHRLDDGFILQCQP